LTEFLSVSNRFVKLRPVRAIDIAPLYDLLSDPATARTWRFRGEAIDPVNFFAEISHSVLCQFLVSPPSSNEVVGFVQLFNYDSRSQCAHVSAAISPAARSAGVTAAGALGLVLDYGFDTFALRKVYFESSQPEVVSALSRFVEPEGPARREGLLIENAIF